MWRRRWGCGGHPIHLAGLDTDSHFRPLNARGEPFHRRPFAAGSILAHPTKTMSPAGARTCALATAHSLLTAVFVPGGVNGVPYGA